MPLATLVMYLAADFAPFFYQVTRFDAPGALLHRLSVGAMYHLAVYLHNRLLFLWRIYKFCWLLDDFVMLLLYVKKLVQGAGTFCFQLACRGSGRSSWKCT